MMTRELGKGSIIAIVDYLGSDGTILRALSHYRQLINGAKDASPESKLRSSRWPAYSLPTRLNQFGDFRATE